MSLRHVEGVEIWLHSFLISMLDWMNKFHDPIALPPVKESRYSLSVPQGRSERMCSRRNALPSPGLETRNVKPVVRRYSVYDVPGLSIDTYSRTLYLSGSAWHFGWICGEFYRTNLPWDYRIK